MPSLPSSASVNYIRCPDGLTCAVSFDDCPTMVTCSDPSHVLCPDQSCQPTAHQCVQPPPNKATAPDTIKYRQRGASCGPQMLKCADGQCKTSCSEEADDGEDCLAQGKVRCMSGSRVNCASSYAECEQEIYCPLSKNFTMSPDSYRCGDGPQVCVLDRERCATSACGSNYAYFLPKDSSLVPYNGFDPKKLATCDDGRCMMNNLCSTPLSCSSDYIKTGSIGLTCVQQVV